MIIYWRVSEAQFTQSFTKRWENKDKRELLRKCWLSIQPGITEEDTVIILWDKVRESTLNWLVKHSNASETIIKECPIYTLDKAVINQLGGVMDKRYHHFSSLADTMHYYTQKYQDEIHYLCNDDFLHLPQALDAMRSVYRDGWQGFVLAYDYPDRYYLDRTRNCELLLNEYSHWRTVPSCTGCTSALGKTWQSYMKLFKQNAIYNSDSFTWEMYQKSGALCPVPGMATHLTDNCMTPRIDWKLVYDSIDIGDEKWD